MSEQNTISMPEFPTLAVLSANVETGVVKSTVAPARVKVKKERRGIQLAKGEPGTKVSLTKTEVLPAASTKRVQVRNAKAETLPVAKVVEALPANVAGMVKLDSTPKGKKLFTYTLAVFSVLGMFTAHRKSVSKDAVRAFFRSGTILHHHGENGNLETTANGSIRLSVAGWNYFYGRITGSTVAQRVDKPEMEALAAAIKSGELTASTARFGTDTRFVPVRIS